MILDYDTRPDATLDEKIRSLRDSIQLALNELESYAEGQRTKGNAEAALRIARQALAAATGGAEPSTTIPLMDGTAAIGTEQNYARGDHRHPTDTSRASASDLSALSTTVSGKVDKETGKGLSTNDYTTAEKNKLAGIESGAQVNRIPFGEVDSSSTSTVFTATIPGITALTDGVAVYLKNGVVTSASGFTLNINGLGAKPVYTNLAAATAETTKFNINYTMLFIYNSTRVAGGCWDCYNGYDSNTNTLAYQVRTGYSTRPASDTGYRYRLWLTSADNQKWVPINTSTATNASTARTLNTRPIDPFGPIVYNSTNGTVNSGSGVSSTTIWQQYNLTIGYSYVKTLTQYDPVYLKCTPQSDGSAVMADIVQALPTSDDGYIYIFLGIASSTTGLELRMEHPVYWHDGNGIRIWEGARPSGGGGITVDTALSDTSENPVQNKVIKGALDTKAYRAGDVTEAVFYSNANATNTQIQMKHDNGTELALSVQTDGWMKLQSLPNDDWSSVTNIYDIPLKTITPTLTISVTTGTLNADYPKVRRFGNVVQILLSVKNSSAIANNGNIFVGTISQSALRPVMEIENTNYYGARPIFGWITTGGVITIRNEGSGNLNANTNVTIAFTYLIA